MTKARKNDMVRKNNKTKKNGRTMRKTETVISMAQNRRKNNNGVRPTTNGYGKNVMNSRLIGTQNKRTRRMKKAKKMAKILLLFLIIIGGIIFALVSPIFNISDIEVENNNQVSIETVISLSQIQEGQNIFKFIKKKIENNLKENPYIESAEIKRKLPNTVKIYVNERTRDYNLEFLNGFAYINKQGYILEISQTKTEGLPIILGTNTDPNMIVEGNRLVSEDLERLNTVIEILNICKNYDLDKKITSINIAEKNDYILYMESEKKDIHLGDNTNLNNKILYIPIILQENQNKEGTIYLNGDLNSNFKPRFREKV